MAQFGLARSRLSRALGWRCALQSAGTGRDGEIRQTRWTQNPLGATPCGFESRSRHSIWRWVPRSQRFRSIALSVVISQKFARRLGQFELTATLEEHWDRLSFTAANRAAVKDSMTRTVSLLTQSKIQHPFLTDDGWHIWRKKAHDLIQDCDSRIVELKNRPGWCKRAVSFFMGSSQ